jgi:hypothetical protein
MYKTVENLNMMADSNMDCPDQNGTKVIDTMILQFFKGVYDLKLMDVQLPSFAGATGEIMNSVKFILKIIKDKYKPLTITGEAQSEYTKEIDNLFLNECNGELANIAAP